MYACDENYVFRKARLCVMIKRVKCRYKYMWNKNEQVDCVKNKITK
jgi:hypothetical protein